MKIYGLEVLPSQEAAVLERMKRPFTNRELRRVWTEDHQAREGRGKDCPPRY